MPGNNPYRRGGRNNSGAYSSFAHRIPRFEYKSPAFAFTERIVGSKCGDGYPFDRRGPDFREPEQVQEAPVALAATNVQFNQFQANWQASTDAEGYFLDVSTDSNFETFVAGWENVDVGNTTSRVVDGLDPEVEYFYRVRAVGPHGTSDHSNIISLVTVEGVTGVPVALAATDVEPEQFQANWTAVDAATGYRLDVSEVSNFASFVTGFADLDVGDVQFHVVSGLDPDTQYFYRVRAVSEFGPSENSNVITVATESGIPEAPVALAATNTEDDRFTANWQAVADATSYRLDVSESSDFSTFVTGFEDLNVGDVTQRLVDELDAETEYFYRVRAVNAFGTSPNSNTISVTTEAIDVPDAPVAQAATNVEAEQFTANWTSVGLATSYRLDVSTVSNFASFVAGFEDLNVGDVTSHVVSGLDPDTEYFYRVRAVGDGGTSANSNTISVTTASEEAWLDGWSYRRLVTSDQTKVASSYPWAMILDLSQFPADFFTKIKSDGSDIRITKADGETELPRGVREVDTGEEEGFVYFKAEDISTSVATEYYIYYGNATANDYADDAVLGMENVYSGDHVGYWPLGETAGGTAKDETAQGNDGSYESNLPTPVAGKIGRAQDFDGSSDRIVVAGDESLRLSSFAISVWIKASASSSGLLTVLNREDPTNSQRVNYVIWLDDNSGFFSNGKVVARVRDGTGIIITLTGATNVLDGNWHHILFRVNNSAKNAHLFVDGSVDASTASYTGDPWVGDADVMVGFQSPSSNRWLDGSPDELFVVAAPLTDNEILTIYNNQSDNAAFWTVGAEEIVAEPDIPVATAATEVEDTSFRANWEAADRASTYRLDVASDAGFTTFVTGYENLDVGAGTSHVVSGLDPETQYWYRVRAVNAAGTSDNSNAIDVTTAAAVFAPDDITNLGLWIDFSDESTLFDATSGGSTPGADGQIARVEDKSGNGRHYTQGTSANRPIRKVGEQNGEDVARFDGTNDHLVGNAAARSLWNGATGGTIFEVYAKNNSDATQTVLDWTRGVDLNYRIRTNSSVATSTEHWTRLRPSDSSLSDASVSHADAGTGFNLKSTRFDLSAQTMSLYFNGLEEDTVSSMGLAAAITNADSDVASIGKRNVLSGSEQHFPGDLIAVLAYRRALTNSEIDQVEEYLQAKFGTPALPE